MRFDTDISKKCEHCGKEIWPQLATAVIVLIRKGHEVLLVHANNFRGDFYGLVAGFVETGETLEEAVHREVMEETGLHITNLRYFGSQPWPYPCGLMVGFTADYDYGKIHLQRSELSKGAWFDRDHLPHIPEKLSISMLGWKKSPITINQNSLHEENPFHCLCSRHPYCRCTDTAGSRYQAQVSSYRHPRQSRSAILSGIIS